MKFVFASDIHGSAFWTEKLLAFIRAENPDKLFLLGDLLYHGPRNPLPDGHDPQKVAVLLGGIKEKIVAVRGNCDAEIDQMLLPFPMLADYALAFANGRTLFLTHGHLFSKDSLPPLSDGDILLNGHFHVPCKERLETGWYLNCGSVALPKENSPHSCLLYKDGTFTWIDLTDGTPFDSLSL